MTQCRYCKSDIPSDATRCPHCTSFLDGEQTQGSQGQVTYIVDKGLVTFAKFAAGALALFVTVGIFLYGLDIKQVSKEIGQVRKEIEDTHVESQRLDLNMRQAKLDMEKETADIQNEAADIQKETAGIKKDIKTAEDAAKVAGDTSLRAQSLLQEAEESAGRIHRYEITLLAPSQGSKLPSNLQASQLGPDPGQVEHLVDTRILEALRNILTPKQYSSLKTKIVAKQNVGLRRQVFDAKNAQDLPGVLVRSEGDPPISDPAANEVYDNLEIIHRFFKEVFSWEIPDNKGKTIVAIIHYGKEYDNGLWNGQELVLGDGDGVIFRKGGFASLSILAHEIAISVNQWTAQLAFQGQSGAMAESFANIMSCLIEQWQKRQTPDEASWLVGADVFAPGFKGRALIDVAHPGTAYDDPNLGKDQQPGHMKDYIHAAADNGGVHTNSGIPNKAFFELSNKIKGYGWEKPGRIWFESFRTLKSNSTFQDLANATLDVAKKTYGEHSLESEAVTQSWATVGITVGPRT